MVRIGYLTGAFRHWWPDSHSRIRCAQSAAIVGEERHLHEVRHAPLDVGMFVITRELVAGSARPSANKQKAVERAAFSSSA